MICVEFSVQEITWSIAVSWVIDDNSIDEIGNTLELIMLHLIMIIQH